MRKHEMAAIARRLTIGTEFATDFESGCIVTLEPNEWYSFNATDSEGIECTFGVAMVISINGESLTQE